MNQIKSFFINLWLKATKKIRVKIHNKKFAKIHGTRIYNYSKMNNGALHPACVIDPDGKYYWLTRDKRRQFERKARIS